MVTITRAIDEVLTTLRPEYGRPVPIADVLDVAGRHATELTALGNGAPHAPASAATAEPAIYKTPVTPEEAFQAIGRLRREARDEIDRLIRFLDKTDDYVFQGA